MVDDHGRTTHRIFEMATQTLLADFEVAAQAFCTALQAVTDLGLVRADFIIPVVDPSFAVTGDANKDVGATASGWVQDGNGQKASKKWPGPKYSLVDADGSIEITGAVATFLAMFEDGNDFELSDKSQIATWIKATLDG
jgi:hypothetical protein